MSNNEMRAEHDADADLDASSSARNVPYNPPPPTSPLLQYVINRHASHQIMSRDKILV